MDSPCKVDFHWYCRHVVEQTVEVPSIWHAITLTGRNCNGIRFSCMQSDNPDGPMHYILLLWLLIHLLLVPHIWVSESGQHWLRWRLVAYSAPSHYLNQCWVAVDWPSLASGTNFSEILIEKHFFFIHVNVSENIVSEMAGILSRRRWDKRLTQAVSRDFGNTTSFFNTITRNLWKPHNFLMITAPSFDAQYRQTSTINRTLGGNKVVDHSDEVAPTTSSFSIEHMTSLDCAKTTARRNEIHLMFGICMFYRFQGNCFDSRQLWLRLPAVSVDAN